MVRADRLPCGTPLDQVLMQVADGASALDTEHQRSCPHCRAALAEITSLLAPLQALSAEHVEAPEGLRTAVMAKVRSLPRNAWYAVVPGDHGATMTAARVIAQVVRLASERVPGVALAVGRGRTEPVTDVGVAGSHVVLDVVVVARLGAHIPTVARQLRARIHRQVLDLVGLAPTEINIHVIDVE